MSSRFFIFPASLAYLNPFQQWLYDFEIHLFTLRTTEGLKNNNWKRFKHSTPHTVLKNKGSQTFERGYFNNFSYLFVLWTICKSFMWNVVLRTLLNKKITCILYDLSYFVKMIHIFADFARCFQTSACHCIYILCFKYCLMVLKALYTSPSGSFSIKTFHTN